MNEIIFSNQIRKRAKDYGLAKSEYLCYAAMRAAGISVSDAWNMTFQNAGLTWPKEKLKEEQEKLENLDGVKKFIDEHTNTKKQSGELTEFSSEELAKATSKENILRDLLKARMLTKASSKEWIDITSKIADYARIKQDEIKEEDTTIHYYLPVNYPTSHKDCLLWQNGKCNPPKEE
jgi:hypothetical protein|nr:MAG TPA: hypothetical protein [Caudoviricetes sp.]